MGWFGHSGREGRAGLFGRVRVAKPDQLYGTGVWRQNRDRFNRAVDRFYATAAAVHEEAPDSAVAVRLAALTHELNEMAQRVDAVAAALHARYPVDSTVVPAHVRAHVGQTPELLTRAAGVVAQAGQAAAMARVSARAGRAAEGGAGAESQVRAAERYVADAAELIAACSTNCGLKN